MRKILTKLNEFRERRIEYSARRPFRASVPFLSVTAVVLAGAIVASSCTFCYTVRADGQSVAYFHGAGTYDAAVVQAETRASVILETAYSFDEDRVSVRPALAPKESIETMPAVADSLMDLIDELEHVYTLTVDGVRVGAAEDEDVLRQALAQVEDSYAVEGTLSVEVLSEVSIRQEYLPAAEGTTDLETVVAALSEPIPQCFPYTVRAGDTVEGILDRFGMEQERFQALNPDVDLTLREPDEEAMASLLYIDEGTPLEEGLTLTIEQSCPRLAVATVSEVELTRTIEPEKQAQPDSGMFTGEERILQEGAAGEERVLARVEARGGLTIASEDLETETLTEPTPLIVATGTQPKPELPEGCLFLWPVRGPITSDYGYRYIFGANDFHRGVDIAAAEGTEINAAEAGTVLFAGERGTYGNLVIVSHHNGFFTYYGHCSKLLVSAGDEVRQGQVVAEVGSTGRSTGPHCHFEVRYGGSSIDPLLYLPGKDGPVRVPVVEEPVVSTPVEPVGPTEPAAPVEEPTTDAVTGASYDPLEDADP